MARPIRRSWSGASTMPKGRAPPQRASKARGRLVDVLSRGDSSWVEGRQIHLFDGASESALLGYSAHTSAKALRLRNEADKLEAFCLVVRAASTAADQVAFAEVKPRRREGTTGKVRRRIDHIGVCLVGRPSRAGSARERAVWRGRAGEPAFSPRGRRGSGAGEEGRGNSREKLRLFDRKPWHLLALGRANEMVLTEKAPRSHGRAKCEFAALEARHHGVGARRCDDGAWRLLDVAQAILSEVGVGHAAFYPGAIWSVPGGWPTLA